MLNVVYNVTFIVLFTRSYTAGMTLQLFYSQKTSFSLALLIPPTYQTLLSVLNILLLKSFKDLFSFFVCLYVFWPCGVSVAVPRLSLVAASEGYCLVVVLRLFAAVASLCGARALGYSGSSSCGSWAQYLWHTSYLPRCMWGLPGPGMKPVSPALAGRFFATRPSGKPHSLSLLILL